jgi:hypothetical protein
VDLNDPVVQSTMLAMLPLPEDGAGGLEFVGGHIGGTLGGTLGGRAAVQEDALAMGAGHSGGGGGVWPVGQGLLGGGAEAEVEEALGPWLALQQLVVKALFQPETQLLALELLAALAEQVARAEGDAAAQRANNAAGGGDGGRSSGDGDGGGGAGGADLFSCLSLSEGLVLGAADGGGSFGDDGDSGGAGSAGVSAPIEAVLGDVRAGMAIALGATLPWLCVHLKDVGPEGVVESFLEASSRAAAALGWPGLAAALAALSGMAGAGEEPEQWLLPLCTVRSVHAALPPTPLVFRGPFASSSHSRFLPPRPLRCLLPPPPGVISLRLANGSRSKQTCLCSAVTLPPQALCAALFPAYSRLVLQRLAEAAQRGDEATQAAALTCIQTVFQASARCTQAPRSKWLGGGGACRAVAGVLGGKRHSFEADCCRRLPDAATYQGTYKGLNKGISLPINSTQVPGLDLGPSAWPAADPRFIGQLSAHLAGPLSGAALGALRAMLTFQGGLAGGGCVGGSAGRGMCVRFGWGGGCV